MFKYFFLLNFLSVVALATSYSHLPPKDAQKLISEGRNICQNIKNFAEKNSDAELRKIHDRHCVQPKEPLLTGLIVGLYHLEIDTARAAAPKADPKTVFYKQQLTKLSILVKRYPDFAVPRPIFNIAPFVTELSGFTLLKSNQTVWSHGDSGNSTAVAHTSPSDRKSTAYQLAGSINTDWEAITNDGENIWILDVGDNKAIRKSVYLYRFAAKDARLGRVEKVSRFEIQYPEGAMDCEAGIYYDNAIYLFEKVYYKTGRVYRVPLRNSIPQKPELLGRYPPTGPITDATLDNKNRLFALTYFGVMEIKNWTKPNEASIRPISTNTMGQTEAIAHIKGNLFWVGREDGNVYEVRDLIPKKEL
ncbi:MAG: hypothetical protein AB7F59_05010 [Bdellovibrionales bacterium]